MVNAKQNIAIQKKIGIPIITINLQQCIDILHWNRNNTYKNVSLTQNKNLYAWLMSYGIQESPAINIIALIVYNIYLYTKCNQFGNLPFLQTGKLMLDLLFMCLMHYATEFQLSHGCTKDRMDGQDLCGYTHNYHTTACNYD